MLLMCLFLVLLTASGMSVTYYRLARQDKRLESRQRIQIAFDILLDDFANKQRMYATWFDQLLQRNRSFSWLCYMYKESPDELGSLQFLIATFTGSTDDLKDFGYMTALNRLALYAETGRLLAVFQGDHVGSYAVSGTGQDTYLSFDEAAKLPTMLFNEVPIGDVPLPDGVAPAYTDPIPHKITTQITTINENLVLRITAPIYRKEELLGVLVGERVYTQQDIEKYAALSKTEINVFVANTFSIGTLPAQRHLETVGAPAFCDALLSQQTQLTEILSVTSGERNYYQGQCRLQNIAGEPIGLIAISLPQEIEQAAIRRIVTAVIAISGGAIVVAMILSMMFSRRTIHAIQQIVTVIGEVAEGDLRVTAFESTHDEIGMLAPKINQMIQQLRNFSKQVQESSYAVGMAADAILQEIETLTHRIEQQTGAVDNTSGSIKRINQFITTIGENTNELLSASEEILSGIHETVTSRQEVTKSIGHLAGNLHMIVTSIDQVNGSAKHVVENSQLLEEIAQQTAQEIQRIDHSLRDVSQNAELSRQLAEDTKEAAQSGQQSVNASIQGMKELKDMVSSTTATIQDVNAWGEQVSSILGLVDEITEQTSLLALNASIISAQAGVHGRGFAVVAEEIKNLARRTKNSTKEIAALIHQLRAKTEAGVKNTVAGLRKADQGMQLATAVKESLDTILERATRSSDRAAGTARVIQDTAASSQIITASMDRVTDMVTKIRAAIQAQGTDLSQVVTAVEDSQAMSEQINHSSLEQNETAGHIEQRMQQMTDKMAEISGQTDDLKSNSHQIVEAMHAIENIADNIFSDITAISNKTMTDLVKQAEVLKSIVNIFKVL